MLPSSCSGGRVFCDHIFKVVDGQTGVSYAHAIAARRPPGLASFFFIESAVMNAKVAVLIDYQNIHLTAHDSFAPQGVPKHETLLHPLKFAEEILRRRNTIIGQLQVSGQSNLPPLGELASVRVYRGAPANQYDPVPYSRSQAQRSEWSRDPRVEVIYRTLRYQWSDQEGEYKKQEKGIDVLLALDAYTFAVNGTFDVVILASHDTDLIPTVECWKRDERVGSGLLETAGWKGSKRIQAKDVRTWDTRLTGENFVRARDRKSYP